MIMTKKITYILTGREKKIAEEELCDKLCHVMVAGLQIPLMFGIMLVFQQLNPASI